MTPLLVVTQALRNAKTDPLRPVSPVAPRRVGRWPQTRPADHSILVTTRVHVSSVSYGLRIHPTRPPVNVGSPHPAGTCPLPTGQCADPSLGTKGPPCAVSRTSSRAQVSMTCQADGTARRAGLLPKPPT